LLRFGGPYWFSQTPALPQFRGQSGLFAKDGAVAFHQILVAHFLQTLAYAVFGGLVILVNEKGAKEPVQSFLVLVKLEEKVAGLVAEQDVLGLIQDLLGDIFQASELPFLLLGASLNFAGFVVAPQLVKDFYQFLVGDAVVDIDGLGFPEPLQSFLGAVFLDGKLAVEVISPHELGMKLD
jgi:hypothetical protein